VEAFRNRQEAGVYLARKLSPTYAHHPDVLVLALPRGGVPVAFQVARELAAPLDVFVVRKLGFPGHDELAMGAIATGGVVVLNRDVIDSVGLPRSVIDHVAAQEAAELERRERLYRHDRPPLSVRGKTVILIDDGLATGATMRAATRALRQLSPAKVVVAVPVAAEETCDEMREEVDEIVCAITPPFFRAVGLWYEDFAQTTDEEVRQLLDRAAAERSGRDQPAEAHRVPIEGVGWG
jgi:predicted phosphoribosyltransferase